MTTPDSIATDHGASVHGRGLPADAVVTVIAGESFTSDLLAVTNTLTIDTSDPVSPISPAATLADALVFVRDHDAMSADALAEAEAAVRLLARETGKAANELPAAPAIGAKPRARGYRVLPNARDQANNANKMLGLAPIRLGAGVL
jgi:hypothetical protein